MAAAMSPRPAGEGTARLGEGSTPVPAEVWEPPAGTGHSLPRAGDSNRCVSLPAGADDSHSPEPRRWRLEFPPRQKLLNSNQRLNHYTKARIVKQIRSDAFLLAKAAKVPPLRRARVDAYYEPPGHGRRDPANWADTAKAAVDGAITDAGVLPDDSSAYLDGPFMHLGPVHPGGRFVLIITEVLETPHA